MNKPGKFRWVICGLLVALSYIDRLIIGIGLYSVKRTEHAPAGHADFDYFRFY